MKKLYLILLIAWLHLAATAQNVVQLEYFIDNDAGIGKNTLVNVTPAADGNFPFTANLNGVSVGYHKLYIRTKDSDGRWSQTIRRNVQVIHPQTTNNIVAAEYFFDTDPGIGNGTAITGIAPGVDIPISFTASTSSLTPGYHKLYIRTKDAQGNWSLTSRRNTEAILTDGSFRVIGVEYTFGPDPGIANASYYSFAIPQADGTFTLTIPQNQVTNGLDTLYLRVKDSTNKRWSHTQLEIKNFSTVACTVPGQPAVIANDSKCSGSIGTYTVAPVTGATSYTWTVPAGWTIISGQGTTTVSLQAPAVVSSTNYTVSVAAVNSCNTGLARTFTVTINPLPVVPTIAAGGTTTLCTGGSVILSSSAATGNQWLKDGVAITGAANKEYTASAAGGYTVKVTNAAGCSVVSAASVVTVNANPATPVITASGATNFCAGGNTTLTSSAASGNQWLKDGIAITSATNKTYLANELGSYTVSVTNASGCTATSAALVVTVNASPATPVITASGATTFCTGGSVTLTSSAASGNQWLKDGVSITGATNTTYPANASGSYSVVTTNASACSATSLATVVTVTATPAIPTITAGGATTFCTGGNLVLTSSAASGNQWFRDGAAIAGATNTTYTVVSAGSYTVTVTISGGCSANSVATVITVVPVPAKPTITQNGNALTSSAASANQWYKDGVAITGATSQTYTPTASGLYTVQSTVNGCSSSLSEPLNFQVTAITDPTALDAVIKIFPNPVPDMLTIINSGINPVKLILYDMLGRRIEWMEKISGTYHIDARRWKSGCYFVVITDERKKKSSVKLLFKQ